MSGCLSYWESKVNTAVDINNVLTPINSVPSQLRRFVEPAVFSNDDCPEFELSRRGTLTKLKCEDKFLGLVTAHQMKDFNHDQLVVLDEQKQRLHSATEVVHSRDSFGLEDDYDLRLYDFTQVFAEGLLASKDWFQIDRSAASDQQSDTDLLFALGFPESEQNIDFDTKKIVATSAFIVGKHEASSITGRKALKPIEPVNFTTDGFSGGPVFRVFIDNGLAQICFAGLVTNASTDKVHYLPFSRINTYFQKLFEE